MSNEEIFLLTNTLENLINNFQANKNKWNEEQKSVCLRLINDLQNTLFKKKQKFCR
jgi:hypothetical protein